MPASALLTASLENAVNQLLALDPDSRRGLAALSGKRLTIFIDGVPIGLTLVFSEQVDVIAEHGKFEEVVQSMGSDHCCIRTRLDVVPELTQTSQLTRLIQRGELALEGELSIAQQTSELFKSLDIDWEGKLADYTGDVVAHQAFSLVNRANQNLHQFLSRARAGLANAVTEEKNIGVNRLAVVHFSDQVNILRDDVQRAETRLRHLEAKLNEQ